jgi:hypothetical protein
MKNHKEFDCVQMKWNIQQRLLSELRGVDSQEVRQAAREKIAADPILGPFLRKVVASCATPMRPRT